MLDIPLLQAKGSMSTREEIISSICGRCWNGLVYRRKAQGEIIVFCTLLRANVPSDIEACSKYMDVKSYNLTELSHMAQMIDLREGIKDGSYR